jgi:hypothetical protein
MIRLWLDLSSTAPTYLTTQLLLGGYDMCDIPYPLRIGALVLFFVMLVNPSHVELTPILLWNYVLPPRSE